MSYYDENSRYSIYPLENHDEWMRTRRTAFDKKPPVIEAARVEEKCGLADERKTPKRQLPLYKLAL